ncbi:hypothetical protein [Paenibacillus assamensis]|uniref:hypothetical protein n=1 Tax=Paenibacillus assamensis TaxID=311244 RepID=UPI000420A2E3|nr:hypothetical protein [Paenibacillus assamensis]
MTIIKMKNGLELPVIRIIGGKELVKGAERDVLTFHFDANVVKKLEDLITIMGDTSRITVEQTKLPRTEDGKQQTNAQPTVERFEYADYTVQTKRSIDIELVSPETPEAPAAYKDIYVIGLAQLTYSEKQLQKLQPM